MLSPVGTGGFTVNTHSVSDRRGGRCNRCGEHTMYSQYNATWSVRARAIDVASLQVYECLVLNDRNVVVVAVVVVVASSSLCFN